MPLEGCGLCSAAARYFVEVEKDQEVLEEQGRLSDDPKGLCPTLGGAVCGRHLATATEEAFKSRRFSEKFVTVYPIGERALD